jgi:hypothetical protein
MQRTPSVVNNRMNDLWDPIRMDNDQENERVLL